MTNEDRETAVFNVECTAVVQDLGDKRVKFGMKLGAVRREGEANAGMPEAQVVMMHLSDPEAAFFKAGKRYWFYVSEVEEPAEEQTIEAGDVGDAAAVLDAGV